MKPKNKDYIRNYLSWDDFWITKKKKEKTISDTCSVTTPFSYY